VDRRVDREVDGFDKPLILSMGESGTDVAVPRILELLDQYDISAGFFIPGQVAEENPDMVHEIDRQGTRDRPPQLLPPESDNHERRGGKRGFRAGQ